MNVPDQTEKLKRRVRELRQELKHARWALNDIRPWLRDRNQEQVDIAIERIDGVLKRRKPRQTRGGCK